VYKMKQILTYSNFNINATDINLFTAGTEGLIFTASASIGISFKIQAPNGGGTMVISGDLIGKGLGYGHSLLASGNGDVHLTMYGTLSEYYRIINTDELEVVVGYPVPFNENGSDGSYTFSSGETTWLPQGVYTGNSYSLDGNNLVIF